MVAVLADGWHILDRESVVEVALTIVVDGSRDILAPQGRVVVVVVGFRFMQLSPTSVNKG